MNRRFSAAALTLALATCGPQHPVLAQAQGVPCAPYEEIAQALRERHKETLRFRADEDRGFQLEFFASEEGTWTLVMRRDGQGCAIASGTAWRERPHDESAF
jgi:hypothetical protein